MQNCLPQRSTDPDALLATYEQLLSGFDAGVIIESVRRFACGEVKEQSKRFAPSTAEFVTN
jgi:hypothetical protein